MTFQEVVEAAARTCRRFRFDSYSPWLRVDQDCTSVDGMLIQRLDSVTGKWAPATIFKNWVLSGCWELEQAPLEAYLVEDVRGKSVRFLDQGSDLGRGWSRAPWLDQPVPGLKVPLKPESVK